MTVGRSVGSRLMLFGALKLTDWPPRKGFAEKNKICDIVSGDAGTAEDPGGHGSHRASEMTGVREGTGIV